VVKKIEVEIDVKNNIPENIDKSKAAFNKLKSNATVATGKMRDSFSKLFDTIGEKGPVAFDKIKRGITKLATSTKKDAGKMEKAFRGLADVAQGVMGAALLKAGARLIKSSESQSLALEILKLKSRDVYDQLLQTEEATFGLANKFDMVVAANKAMAFQIDLSEGKLSGLMKISAKLASVMGIDVKTAFDRLVTSTARQQKLIADDLGVMIDLVKVYEDYADELGITKAQLDEQQQSQAFLNELLKQGKVITGELTDEFIKSRTKGTQAIKTIETSISAMTKTAAEGFVWLGTSIGEFFAKAQGYNVIIGEGADEYRQYVAEFKEGVRDKIAEIRKEEAAALEQSKNIIHANKIRADAQRRIEKEATADSYDTWLEYYQARKELDREYLENQKKLAKQVQAQNDEFADDGVWVDGRIVSETALDRTMRRTNEIISKAEAERTKKKKKPRRRRAKKDEAGEDVLGGLGALWQDTIAFADEQATMYELKQDELNEKRRLRQVAADQELYRDLLDQKLEFDEQVRIANQKSDEVQRRNKEKQQREERAKTEKHFSLLQSFGSDYMDAILEGQFEAFPLILAQQAKMFGQTLVWDGIKTLWMGNAKNALFPGLGASAVAVGTAEIGIGVGMMAAGGVAAKMLDTSSDSGDGGAGQRNEAANAGPTTINMNVRTALYDSRVESREKITELIMGE